METKTVNKKAGNKKQQTDAADNEGAEFRAFFAGLPAVFLKSLPALVKPIEKSHQAGSQRKRQEPYERPELNRADRVFKRIYQYQQQYRCARRCCDLCQPGDTPDHVGGFFIHAS
ncbi:MAG: hypothetical protein NTY45_12050 [Elusimicrobia bacterium]|nr:hypothetical protein [Elusimicrobiota bacterium]